MSLIQSLARNPLRRVNKSRVTKPAPAAPPVRFLAEYPGDGGILQETSLDPARTADAAIAEVVSDGPGWGGEPVWIWECRPVAVVQCAKKTGTVRVDRVSPGSE